MKDLVNEGRNLQDKFKNKLVKENLMVGSVIDLNENFPGPGETVLAKDIDYDMLDYFNRTNKKLSIDTKTKKGIHGSVGKMYNDLVFNGDSINKKDIVQVKILESNVKEATETFPDEKVGNDQILFKKEWERINGGKVSAKYNLYYKGYDIDLGGRIFKSVAELERFMKDYILSISLYNKYRNMPEKTVN